MMKLRKLFYTFLILFTFISISNAELKFDPIALTIKNNFLFNSIEIIAGNQYNRTLFYGSMQDGKTSFDAVSFYPEHLFYSKNTQKIFIQNRMGLYSYDIAKEEINTVDIFPNLANKDEYVLSRLSKICFSPNYRYAIGKITTSNVKSSIFLYDLINNTVEEIITDVEVLPGTPAGDWSRDSKYFIYQKKGQVYYFSIDDYKKNKLLNEEWRLIGNVKLSNISWTDENFLIWIEDNLIFKADPNQFFSRSIYKKYLRQGIIVGKIPFDFDPAFDSFTFNGNNEKFILVKNHNSIFYYSMLDDLHQNPYLLLEDNMRFEDCFIFDNGEAIILTKKLNKGKLEKKIIILRKYKNNFLFKSFDPEVLYGAEINNFSVSNNNKFFVVNTSKGSYCFNSNTLDLEWKYEAQEIIQAININYNEWLLGGINTSVSIIPKANIVKPIFASSFEKAGFIDENITIISNKIKYTIDSKKKTIAEYLAKDFELYKEESTSTHRLISREINKGFYQEGLYIKELYSGKLSPVTGEPSLRYKLYQPEIVKAEKYYYNPSNEKYEIALVFNGIKSAEGIFPILAAIEHFKIDATFFLNGNFMKINPSLTKEISNFDIEIGNMFQYYANLTDSDFLIDKNFIRQGLSTNEEIFHNITGKNFASIWHSPMYSFNDAMIKFGEESGYKFVSYNLDTLDWVGKNNIELNSKFYMSNSEIIDRILKKVKPGQIIILSTGKNDSDRSEWLFDDLDLLISELVRAGYSFTTVTDLLKKYRDAK